MTARVWQEPGHFWRLDGSGKTVRGRASDEGRYVDVYAWKQSEPVRVSSEEEAMWVLSTIKRRGTAWMREVRLTEGETADLDALREKMYEAGRRSFAPGVSSADGARKWYRVNEEDRLLVGEGVPILRADGTRFAVETEEDAAAATLVVYLTYDGWTGGESIKLTPEEERALDDALSYCFVP